MMNPVAKSFVERTHFLDFNEKRVDLDVMVAYNCTPDGSPQVLIWNDGSGMAASKDFLDQSYGALPNHVRPYQYLLDCLKDTPEAELNDPNHVIVIGLRKEAGSRDTPDSVVKRLWVTDYDFNAEGITAMEPVLDAHNNKLCSCDCHK